MSILKPIRSLMFCAALVAPLTFLPAAHAQSQPSAPKPPTKAKVYKPNARMANQDQRIAQGERSGQMSSGEAAKATAQQSRIDRQTAADRAANGGKLTGHERQQINSEQNKASRTIYNDKHNANTVKPNAIDNREANQQARTAQGLRTGKETAGEASRTNARQAAVDKEVHNERTTGGGITPQQRQQINRQQNRDSNQIYQEKHNDVTRPEPPKN